MIDDPQKQEIRRLHGVCWEYQAEIERLTRENERLADENAALRDDFASIRRNLMTLVENCIKREAGEI